jgi:hypothetical protein
MADNQNTPGAQGPNQGSNQLRSTGKELLDSLKEQLRLEGDYRDILRDSVRELQKSIKQHDTIAAKLESYSNSTINIKQVQYEINQNLIKQNINKIKLNEATKKLGGLESEQIKIADAYLKALDERSNLEDDYLSKRAESFGLENKLKTNKEEEFKSVAKYFDKLEDQRKLEEYIATLRDKKGNNAKKDLAFNEQKLGKLKDEIALQQQSFSVDQQDYINSKNIVAQAEESVKNKEIEVATMQRGLNLEQAAYVQAKKNNELFESNNQKLKSQEEFEKRSQKNAGILGGLVGVLANKFGIAEQVQKDMVEQQKKLAAEALASGKKSGTFYDKFSVAKTGIKSLGRGLVDTFKSDPVFKYGAALGAVGLAYKGVKAGLDMVGNGAAKAGNYLAGMSKHSGTLVRDLASNVSDLARKIPFVGGLLGGLVDGFAAILDLMLGVDDHAVKIGRQLNLSADAARGLARSYREMSFTNGDIFITAEKMLESQAELATSLGVTNNLGGQILAKNIKLKEFAGLELDTRTKLAETSKISGQDATNAVLAQVVGLKRATGISFQYQAILKEAAGQSGYLGLQFAKYPAQLTKSLLTVKSMGMELKQLDSIADSFLDFESSISKEFEAQLLTGKEINLTKAREAFLNNDLATAAAEITKQVGSTEDFLKLNRIQADSLASAFGMSRDQMGEMLRQQELLAKLGAKQGDSAREQLRLGLERYGNEKALSEAIGDQAYQSMVNASTQEKLAAMIEKIKESIVSFVMESKILDKITAFIDYISEPKHVREILQQIKGFFADAVEFIGTAAHYILEGLDYIAFGQIPDEFIDSIKSGAITMGEQIRSFGEGGMQQNNNNVSESAAKDKLKSEPSSKKEDNSMSMVKAPIIHNTNNITVEPVTAKVMVNTITKQGNQDNTPGQMNTGQ